MSSGAMISTYLVPETTPGETPEIPEWHTLRLTSNTLSPSVDTERSEEIRDTRMAGGGIITSLDYQGDLGYEFSAESFDHLLEAAFYGTWEADTPSVGIDTLEIGSDRHTFTIVKGYRDIDVWTTFTGVHIGSMSIDIPEQGRITGSFTCMGLGYEDADASPIDGDTINPPKTTIPMGSATSVGDIEIDDTALAGSACISAMSLEIDNTMQVQRCLGKAGPGALIATRANVTGTVTMAWSQQAWAIWKNMLTRQAVKLTFPLTDGGNTYTFEIGEAELDGDLPDGSNEDIIQVELNLMARNTPIKVTRSLAA